MRESAAGRGLLSACVIVVAGCSAASPATPAATAPAARSGAVPVIAVIDGDSVAVGPPRLEVRLIGINAPERDQVLHGEATAHLRDLLAGHRVHLATDVEVRDRHGRTLAYVHRDDGLFVNLEMVRAGFAQALTVPPNVAHLDAFRRAEREARDAGRGLWRPSELTLAISAVEADPAGPDDRDLNGEWVQVVNAGRDAVDVGGATLSDAANATFRFPPLVVEAGGSLRVFTGSGRASAVELYWGLDTPVWNNDGDTVTLRDADGLLVDVHHYGR